MSNFKMLDETKGYLTDYISNLQFHITKSLKSLDVYMKSAYGTSNTTSFKVSMVFSKHQGDFPDYLLDKLESRFEQDQKNIGLLEVANSSLSEVFDELDWAYGINEPDWSYYEEFFQEIVDDLFRAYKITTDRLEFVEDLIDSFEPDNKEYEYASLKYYQTSRNGIKGLIIFLDVLYGFQKHFSEEEYKEWENVNYLEEFNGRRIAELEYDNSINTKKYKVRFEAFEGQPAGWEEEFDMDNDYNPFDDRDFEAEGSVDESIDDNDLEDGEDDELDGIYKAKLIDVYDEYDSIFFVFRIDDKKYTFKNSYIVRNSDMENMKLKYWAAGLINHNMYSINDSNFWNLVTQCVGNTYRIEITQFYGHNSLVYDYDPEFVEYGSTDYSFDNNHYDDDDYNDDDYWNNDDDF